MNLLNFHFRRRIPLSRFPSSINSSAATATFLFSPSLYPPFSTLSAGNCDLDNALNLFDELSRTRPLPSVKVFNKILSSLVKLEQYSIVISLFKHMRILKIPINEYTMSIAINAYCLSNLTTCAFSILGLFFKLGHVPNAHTFSPLLKGLFREERISEAQVLFKKIVRERLCEMNVVLNGCVIDGFCKAGYTAVAVQLIRSMEKSGVKADTHVHCMIIRSLCVDVMVDSALKIFNEMPKKSVFPTVITYNSLIFGLCNLGRWKEVIKFVKEMMSCKMYPEFTHLLP